MAPLSGNGLHQLPGPRIAQVGAHLGEQLGEIVAALPEITPQRVHGVEVAAGRSPEAEIDAPWIQGRERTELLGDHEGRMVGQHDAAAAHANGRSRARHMPDEHRRRRTRQPLN